MPTRLAERLGDEAVSPVVGVILMVAITVVLAAVVFVLVNGLGKSSQAKPLMAFTQEPTRHEVIVQQSDPADWADVEFGWATGSDTTCTVSLNGGTAMATPGAMAASPATVHANDRLTVADPSGSLHKCVLQLRHGPTRESYGTWSFSF